MREWYYQVMGEVVGPFTPREFRRLVREGTITRDTFVRKGEGEWVLADAVEGLLAGESKLPSDANDFQTEFRHRFCSRCNRTLRAEAGGRWCSYCGEWAEGAEGRERPQRPGAKPNPRRTLTPMNLCLIASGVAALALALVLGTAVALKDSPSKSAGGSTVNTQPPSANKGFMGQSPEQAAREVQDKINSTPEGRAAAERLEDKDAALTAFQRTHGVSDRIAEAAIKEWVQTHGGNFDWNLEDVKAICLRNLRDGIPYKYLPESEKRK